MSNEEINNQVDVTGTNKLPELLTKRPEELPFEQYKALMKIQKKLIKKYKKGKLVWLSKLEATPAVLNQLYQDNMMQSLGGLLKKGETFVGSTKDLK